MQRRIELMSDFSERVPYNIAGLPIYSSWSLLSTFAGMASAAHWHDDLEFGVVHRGRMRYSVNGEPLIIEEGQGIFINARQLHNNDSADGGDCEYACVLIHPSLISTNSFLDEHYVQPILTNDAFTHCVLDPDTTWHRELMEAAHAVQRSMAEGTEPLGLVLQSLSSRIAAVLHKHMPDPSGAPGQVDQRLLQLRNMVGHVQRHYAEPMTLNDIAAAGNTGKSNCCALFQRHLHQTPIGYLMGYRLGKAAELLHNPNLSVTEVALAVGFSSPSYFAERFNRHLGLTPSGYRKRAIDHAEDGRMMDGGPAG